MVQTLDEALTGPDVNAFLTKAANQVSLGQQLGDHSISGTLPDGQGDAVLCVPWVQKARLAAEDVQDLTRAQLSTACSALELLTQDALQTFSSVIAQCQEGDVDEDEVLEAQVRASRGCIYACIHA